MTVEHRQDVYEFPLKETGETVSYEIRGLGGDQEMEAWAHFCASVFAYKENPPPASYFERHYHNDPTRVASLIRVAMLDGKIVASCRLFLRTISNGAGMSLSAGGIGEVCTSDDHRRRGLSKVLLQNVIDIMKERQLQVSLLHASPEFFPVYEKAGGYACSKSQWSVVPINTGKLQQAAASIATTTSTTTIREASFPDDTDRLSALHRNYSEARFSGCMIRSNEYWNQYLCQELIGTFYVLQMDDDIVAWISLRPRGLAKVQLREFGVDTTLENGSQVITTITALTLLLAHAMKELEHSTTTSLAEEEWIHLALPTFVLEECRSTGSEKECLSYVDWSKLTPNDDLGWMYKILNEKAVPSIESINGTHTPHLIWPSDSF